MNARSGGYVALRNGAKRIPTCPRCPVAYDQRSLDDYVDVAACRAVLERDS